MDNCKKTLAEGFGLESYRKMDTTFYMDLAAVAGRLDVESRGMSPGEKEALRQSWSRFVDALDKGLATQS